MRYLQNIPFKYAFSGYYRSFSKIAHILGHKTIQKKIAVMFYILTDCRGIKIDINNKINDTKLQSLKDTLLNYIWLIEEIKKNF